MRARRSLSPAAIVLTVLGGAVILYVCLPVEGPSAPFEDESSGASEGAILGGGPKKDAPRAEKDRNVEVAWLARRIQALADFELEEASRRCEMIYGELSTKKDLAFFADDLLLQKARVLIGWKKHRDATKVLELVAAEYPTDHADLWKGRAMCLPGPVKRRTFELCGQYCERNPNRTTDLAGIGIAQCAIALGDYLDAERTLGDLIPEEGERTPSEDPLVRCPGPDGYLDFLDDGRFRDIVSERSDKIALLLLARCKAAQGKKREARELYEMLVGLFPCSAGRAISELRHLELGEVDEIVRRLRNAATDPQLVLPFDIPRDKVLEILEIPEHTRRIEEARAYLAKMYLSEP